MTLWDFGGSSLVQQLVTFHPPTRFYDPTLRQTFRRWFMLHTNPYNWHDPHTQPLLLLFVPPRS